MRKIIYGIMKRSTVLFVAALSLISACGENAESRYEAGYDDGYAVGYNTACEIRATLIDGDWNNKHYSKGYSDGIEHGIAACNTDRRKE